MQIDSAIVLVVEDNETSMAVAKGLLKLLKTRADTAPSGQEALRMVREKRYNLILMDHFMPGMDGIEATQAIRSMDEEYYQSVPIIALTANEEPGAKESCLLAGMDDFLAKPLGIAELRDVLNRYLPTETPLKPLQAPSSGAVFPSELSDIEGIDAKEGVRNSGSEAHFIRLLKDFYRIIDLKSDQMEEYLALGQLKKLTIEAHALKSTARILGAGELSEEFRRLELLGLSGDGEALIRETPGVVRRLRRFKPLLKDFAEQTERRKTPVSRAELTGLLQSLIAAVDRFDLDGADEALDKLDGCSLPAALNEHMELLKAYSADVAMEKIMETARIMEEIIRGEPRPPLY